MAEHKLFVGGLSWNTDDDGLWNAFSKFGNITFQRVCTDRESGQSRGFGFVSFDSEDNANKAVAEMDGKELDGRNIKVNIAMPREPKGGKGEGGAGGEWSPRPQGVCFAFQKGQCDRGDACRFSHTEAKEGDAAASSWSKPPCFAFQKGECWRGDDCRFSHEAEGEKKEEKAEEEVDEKKRKFFVRILMQRTIRRTTQTTRRARRRRRSPRRRRRRRRRQTATTRRRSPRRRRRRRRQTAMTRKRPRRRVRRTRQRSPTRRRRRSPRNKSFSELRKETLTSSRRDAPQGAARWKERLLGVPRGRTDCCRPLTAVVYSWRRRHGRMAHRVYI